MSFARAARVSSSKVIRLHALIARSVPGGGSRDLQPWRLRQHENHEPHHHHRNVGSRGRGLGGRERAATVGYRAKLPGIIRDLLELDDGDFAAGDEAEVPFELVARRYETVRVRRIRS
jgi:hypothetical protein